MEILNSSLKACVSRIRKILCSPLEQINEQIIFQLKKVSGVSYYEEQVTSREYKLGITKRVPIPKAPFAIAIAIAFAFSFRQKS